MHKKVDSWGTSTSVWQALRLFSVSDSPLKPLAAPAEASTLFLLHAFSLRSDLFVELWATRIIEGGG